MSALQPAISEAVAKALAQLQNVQPFVTDTQSKESNSGDDKSANVAKMVEEEGTDDDEALYSIAMRTQLLAMLLEPT